MDAVPLRCFGFSGRVPHLSVNPSAPVSDDALPFGDQG